VADSNRDDRELLRTCADGGEHALGALYDRYGKRAYAVALRVLRDPALAEDAVQDAFLAVWRRAATYDPGRGDVSTWIFMLVHRRAVDLVRRQHRFNTRAAERDAPNPADGFDDDAALRTDVQVALRALSSAEREVLDLAYWRGLTQSQIATTLGIPQGTVKSRTFSALAKLRNALRHTAYHVAAAL